MESTGDCRPDQDSGTTGPFCMGDFQCCMACVLRPRLVWEVRALANASWHSSRIKNTGYLYRYEDKLDAIWFQMKTRRLYVSSGYVQAQ
jgi:hypothetical protein